MHFSQLVVACALAVAPTAVVATQAAAAFVTVSSDDSCPRGAATSASKPGPKTVVTDATCQKVKISHDLSVSYYNFDIEPITKETASCCVLKVYDNAGCIGFPVVKLPIEGPANDQCTPERYFDDEVKYISMQLECEEKAKDDSAKGVEHAPKQQAEHGSEKEEHAPKQQAEHGAEKEEHAPKQQAEHGSEQGEQSPKQEAPERKAASPADSLGLGDITKVLGFR